MAQLTVQSAGALAPAQAAELARVMELQASWENLRDDPTAGGAHGPGLRERQRRYDAFRSALAGYTARYRSAELPELTLNSPERVGTWCRAVRTVCRRAEDGAVAPVQVVAKAYRLADRIAARLKVSAADRGATLDGMDAAVRGLDTIIAWCDALSPARRDVTAPEVKPHEPTAPSPTYPVTIHLPVSIAPAA